MTSTGSDEAALAEALAGVRRVVAVHGRLALDTEARADLVDAALAAVWQALGPTPTLLAAPADRDARRHRADLADLDPALVLAVPAAAILYPPVEVQRRRVARMVELDVPAVVLDDERALLARLTAVPAPPAAWDQVFVLRDQLARWPGYTRRGQLSIETARQVAAAWTFDRDPWDLLDDAATALGAARRARRPELRDQLSLRSFEVAGAANAAVRAAVQAHDRVTANPARDDQTDLEYLAEHAWPGPSAEFTIWWSARALAVAARPVGATSAPPGSRPPGSGR